MGRARYVPGAQPNMVQTLAALEYRANNRDSYVLQFDGNSRAVRTGNRIADNWQATATFGYQRVLDRHHLLSSPFRKTVTFTTTPCPLSATSGRTSASRRAGVAIKLRTREHRGTQSPPPSLLLLWFNIVLGNGFEVQFAGRVVDEHAVVGGRPVPDGGAGWGVPAADSAREGR